MNDITTKNLSLTMVQGKISLKQLFANGLILLIKKVLIMVTNQDFFMNGQQKKEMS